MTLKVQIRIVTPFLGSLQIKDRTRVFRKERNLIFINLGEWTKQFVIAEKIINTGQNLNSLVLPEKILSPTLQRHTKFCNSRKIELFECIVKNTIVTFLIEINTKLEGHLTPTGLKALMVYIGEHLGLSDWHNKAGYGRFNVLNVEEVICT